MKGLPLTYNRDMQEDKEPLFDTVDTLKGCLGVYEKLIPRLKVNQAVMEKALAEGFLNATDVADYLVTKGMAFRDAHRATGKLVRYAIEQGKEIQELSLKELEKSSKLFSEDLFDILSPAQMINRRESIGGTAEKNVVLAIEKAKSEIANERQELEARGKTNAGTE
jgi:argininosuccinate lyase